MVNEGNKMNGLGQFKNKTGSYAGVIAAMITPCKAPGIVDCDEIKNLSRALIKGGCHGLFVVGSSGELPFLDEDQRREIVISTRDGVGEDAVLYAGISGTGVKQAIRYAENAAEDGADVAIVMAPFLLKLSQNELLAYVREIADGSPIPVSIYNHLRMPSVFEVETIIHLAEHPNIVAIKDTSMEVTRGVELAEKLHNLPMAMFQGREPFLLDTLAAGAAGSVTALANIAPEWHRGLYDAIQTGNIDTATEFQDKILNLFPILRLPEVGESFAGFAYALRCAAKARGYLDTVYGMVPGFTPTDKFTESIYSILRGCGLVEDRQV